MSGGLGGEVGIELDATWDVAQRPEPDEVAAGSAAGVEDGGGHRQRAGEAVHLVPHLGRVALFVGIRVGAVRRH